MVSFTTLLTLAAGALAAPAPADTQSPPQQVLPAGYPNPWAWHVEDFEAGCVRSGCYYRFNLSVPATEAYPQGGKYSCSGTENGEFGNENTFEDCSIVGDDNAATAAAKLGRRINSEPPKQLYVSFLKPGSAADQTNPYNFTAITTDWTYNAFVAVDEEFDVYPTIWQQYPLPQSKVA
ncbi:hypothetical protein COCCADRAFT_3191 [Bipolaris zeicola 26-R-13]|uniref:AA1-like domain-containing protein n=1 Tax=Cochliobolus carbonum (strain 26-R-13) TaxID=930089 RepID=W6Y7P5_COCC2|nr:uncharacterized protein COCCADRAFT_3191 [Bipolaris zeicola 26-R-13]EUC35652.1 hypothetical protein COCCADRAFT_3191 [Bipolaris zeicola 26-R-13]